MANCRIDLRSNLSRRIIKMANSPNPNKPNVPGSGTFVTAKFESLEKVS